MATTPARSAGRLPLPRRRSTCAQAGRPMKRISQVLIFWLAWMLLGAPAIAQQGADYVRAERAFMALGRDDRFELPMLLIATGHYNGMSTGEFGRRLFRGVREYQASIGAPQTGYLEGDQLGRLRVSGFSVISAWGFSEIRHPQTEAKLNVPLKIAPRREVTRRGYAFSAYDNSVAVDFSFFASSDVPLEELYARLTSSVGGRRVDYKVIRPTFFAIAGGQGERGFYIRYQLAIGGSVGFTTSWDLARIYRGDRIANLMSNLFFVPLASDVALTPSVQEPAPQAVPLAPLLPSQAVEPPAIQPPAPRPAATETRPAPSGPSSGTGFFVTPMRLVTNAHVVQGCLDVMVAVGQNRGLGRVLARDAANDVALIKIETMNGATAKFRSGVRLGEDVAAFGFPLSGFLSAGGNFTRGSVTATAGLRDDTSRLQVSAPVQPGNSGGPLLDESGNVVGVVASQLKPDQLAGAAGDYAQNVNFAIKSSVVQTFLETNDIQFETGALGDAMKPADLAARAQSISAVVECRP